VPDVPTYIVPRSARLADASTAIVLWAFALVVAVLNVIHEGKLLNVIHEGKPREYRALLFAVVGVALVSTWQGVLRLATELSSDGKSVRWRTPVRKGSLQVADIVSIEFSRNERHGSNRIYRRIVPFNGKRVVIHYADGFDAFLMSIGVSDRDKTQPGQSGWD
jgi:hypothetical protein